MRRIFYLSMAVGLSACSAGSNNSPRSEQGGDLANPNASAGSGGSSTGGGQEQELESSFGAPVATGNFVWVANADSGRVAYINAATAEVHTVLAGNGPTTLAAIPDATDDLAIVLNTLSSDATLLREHAGSISTSNIALAPGHNTWAIAKSGAWAIAWTDSRQIANAPAVDGFQDISIISTANPSLPATILSVGYRPVAIAFSADESRAFAVTEDGVTVVTLGVLPAATSNVALSDDPLDDPGSRDVVITGDGAFALVRRDTQSAITIADLNNGVLSSVDLGAAVTDLDLADDGVHAIAVARDSGLVAEITPASATLQSVTITDTTVGSVVAAQDAALLYTNASAVDRLTILDLSTNAYREVRLYAPVLAVFPNLSATHAVVLHQSASGNAFSLVPLAVDLPAKIVAAEAPPAQVALSPAGDAAIVSVRDDKQGLSGAYVAKLPELSVQFYALGSPPTAAGIVAGANQAYVAQLHPQGRITLIDLASGAARTLTGFELQARVVTGAAP